MLGHVFGLDASFTALHIFLPVGISFYLFQTTSYVVDIYKERIRPSGQLLDFSVYVDFFPQRIAGPILSANKFLPQLSRLDVLTDIRFRFYLFLFGVGFFKKACVGDNLAMFIDPIFADVDAYNTYTLWIAATLYTIQLYCDFSGFSDMAIEQVGMLGFHLPKNFYFPYFASNLGAFWRRWHITLSTWLPDYVFFPLGGSSLTEPKVQRDNHDHLRPERPLARRCLGLRVLRAGQRPWRLRLSSLHQERAVQGGNNPPMPLPSSWSVCLSARRTWPVLPRCTP